MISRKEHLKQINRFHDKVEEISNKIKEIGDDESRKVERGELSMKLYYLIQLWGKIDDGIEFTVKHYLDMMNNETIETLIRDINE